MRERLLREARPFANQATHLLNRTVTDGSRLSVRADSLGRAVIGYRIGKNNVHGQAIPLTTARVRPRIHLFYLHTLDLDESGKRLTTHQSTYKLLAADASTEILTFEYSRDPGNEYPSAHLHVEGHSVSLRRMLDECGLQRRKPADLHFPVGGPWFRPSLEDVVEFCILERLVIPRDGWREVLGESRLDLYRRQAWVTASCFQDEAANALAGQGWQVSPPPDDKAQT